MPLPFLATQRSEGNPEMTDTAQGSLKEQVGKKLEDMLRPAQPDRLENANLAIDIHRLIAAHEEHDAAERKQLAELIDNQIDWVFEKCDRRTTINLDDILKVRIHAVLEAAAKSDGGTK